MPLGPGSVSVAESDPRVTCTGRSSRTSMALKVTETVQVPVVESVHETTTARSFALAWPAAMKAAAPVSANATPATRLTVRLVRDMISSWRGYVRQL